MNENELKNRLSFWKVLSDKDKAIKSDVFVQFMIYWLIFDGYISEMADTVRDMAKLQWLYKTTDTPLRKKLEEHFASPSGQEKIQWFMKRNGVLDMNPWKSGGRKTITRNDNFQEIIEVIYQVKRNLFHATNQISDGDEEEVRAALALIKEPIRKWLAE